MAKARVSLMRLDRAGVRALMQSDSMLNACMEAGEAIAARAGDGYIVEPAPDQRTTRASANVLDPSPRAMGREAATGNLARAVSSMTEAYKWR